MEADPYAGNPEVLGPSLLATAHHAPTEDKAVEEQCIDGIRLQAATGDQESDGLTSTFSMTTSSLGTS